MGRGVCFVGKLGILGGGALLPGGKGRQKGVPHLAVSLHRDGDPAAVHHLHLIGPDADQVGAVDRILIHENHAIEIVFKYRDEYQQTIEYVLGYADELDIAV